MTKSVKVPFSVTSAGATSLTRYVGGTTTGAPTGATFSTGDWAVAQNGRIWVCTAGGTPGTWSDAGVAPNMVTTDTTQTVTGDKTFTGVLQLGSQASSATQVYVGPQGTILSFVPGMYIADNVLFDGTNWRLLSNATAGSIAISGAGLSVYAAPANISGSPATMTQTFGVNNVGVATALLTSQAPKIIATGNTGATQANRWMGGTATGAPASGTFQLGDWITTRDGHIFICTSAGTPGTWVDAGSSGGAVSSVAGRTGAVTLTAADIGAGTFPAGTFIFPSDLRAANSFLASASGAGYTQVKVGDATHTGSVNFYAANDNRQGWIGFAATTGVTDTGTLAYTAGTHAFTGNATVSGTLTTGTNASAGAAVYVNAAAAQTKVVVFQTAGAFRWVVGSTLTAESGSNAGSDFRIWGYDDAGTTVLGSYFQIARATGAVTMPGTVTGNGFTSTANSVTTGFGNSAVSGFYADATNVAIRNTTVGGLIYFQSPSGATGQSAYYQPSTGEMNLGYVTATSSQPSSFSSAGTNGRISVAYNGATADNNNYGIVGVTAPVGVNTAYYSMTVAGTAIAGMGMDGTNTLRIGTINSGKTMSANSVKIDSSGNVTTVGNVIAAAHSATGLTGAVAASRYVGGTASGAPSSGTFATGDFVVAQNGHIWVCTAGASPGTWVDAGSYGAGGGGASLSVANTWTASQTFQTSDGSQPLFVKARITANGGQSGPLATFAAADGTTYLTIDASANLTSVGTGKFKTGVIGVGGSTYGSLLFEKYTSATSGATTRDSSTTSFRTAYWNGSVSVDEDLTLQANRASTTAADVDLTLNTGRFKAPAFVATGLTGSTASGRWVGTTVTGPPTTGAHLLGDFVNSQDGNFYTCTAAGTPGSWMVSTGSGAAGPAGPQGGTELAAVEVSAGYTVTVKDGTTYTDIPGGSFTIPAGQAFDLEMMAYLTVRLDTGASIGDARVDLRVVDSAVTQVYASDSHRFYWLTVVTAGTQAWNNRLMFCKKRFAAQASPLTLKLQTMCTANLSSTVTFTATNALAQPLQMIATAR